MPRERIYAREDSILKKPVAVREPSPVELKVISSKQALQLKALPTLLARFIDAQEEHNKERGVSKKQTDEIQRVGSWCRQWLTEKLLEIL